MANLITLSRFPVLIAVILLLGAPSPVARLVGAFAMAVLIALDTVDGVVARAREEVSLMGSVIDIMADRAVELVMWVVYAHLGLVPVGIPIIYIIRGTIVDSLRSVHVSEGKAPFKAMRTTLGQWLVGSPIMRTSYGVSKFLSFTGLAVTHALFALASRGDGSIRTAETSLLVFSIMSWISVGFCLVRGLPVIIEALQMLNRAPDQG